MMIPAADIFDVIFPHLLLHHFPLRHNKGWRIVRLQVSAKNTGVVFCE
jgi:hypothetical protein